MRRGVGLALVSASLLGLMISSAEAAETVRFADGRGDGPDPEANAGVITIGDGQIDSGGAGPRRRGGSLECTYHRTTEDAGESGSGGPVPAGSGITRNPVPGAYYGLTCRDENGQEVVNRTVLYDPVDAAPAVDPEVLAEEAAARLAVAAPSIELSPKADVNQIVQLPTWMWVSNWEPDSATASVPGVSATVTATPASVTWDMGNGDQVVCSGPGTPYDFSRPEEAQSTDCSYTYRHSSSSQPGGVYQVSATMSYDVSWSAEGAPGGGALPTVSETSTFPVRVIEIHAVEGVGTGAG